MRQRAIKAFPGGILWEINLSMLAGVEEEYDEHYIPEFFRQRQHPKFRFSPKKKVGFSIFDKTSEERRAGVPQYQFNRFGVRCFWSYGRISGQWWSYTRIGHVVLVLL